MLKTAGHNTIYSTFNSKLDSSFKTLYNRASIEITTPRVVELRRQERNDIKFALLVIVGESRFSTVVLPVLERLDWVEPGPNIGRTVRI